MVFPDWRRKLLLVGFAITSAPLMSISLAVTGCAFGRQPSSHYEKRYNTHSAAACQTAAGEALETL